MDDFGDMSSSLLKGANVTAPLYEFLGTVPGFGWLQDLVSQWVKLDIRMIAAALTILGTLSGVFQFLQALTIKMYWYITRFFTASVSINARDKLNREVLNWVGAQVLTRQGTRIVTARSEQIESDAYNYQRARQPRIDYDVDKRKPIQYLPTFGSTWFLHKGNIFIVRRVNLGSTGMSFMDSEPDEFASAPEGIEPLVIMCLGRSVEPIKRFLNTCRDFAEKQREAYVTVRVSRSRYDEETWETTILRPVRPIETIHFDEKIRAELVADVKNYLDPATRRFYNQRGIPYRRGYLLHGPAGTGKTSLSLALAGLFGLELYLLHVPSVNDDKALERLFTALPPQCFILLEDIDAVGIQNRGSFDRDNYAIDVGDDDDDDDDDSHSHYRRAAITLSGLLNVLDGVSSQEGRIVLMTSNFAEKLDRALIRPGRIDRMIFLGHISPRSAELMFMRMYERDPTTASLSPELKTLSEGRLEKLALQFSSKIKDGTFTPAQLQGYLLLHRSNPQSAVEGLDAWMREEMAQMEAAKRRAKEATLLRRRRRKQRRLNLMVNPHMGMVAPGNPNTGLLGVQQVNDMATPPISARNEAFCGDADDSVEAVA